MTNGSQLDPVLSIITEQPGTELGGVERDSCLVTNEDSLVFYEDRVLRVLLSEAPLGLRLIGQADLSHRGVIDQALRRTERGVGDVLVDLTELEFIDVGGARQLIDHAGVLGIDGRGIRITGARAPILRIFQVCLSSDPPNLFIDDASKPDPAGTAAYSSTE
jgi:anti-anti-sigma regulatory factor